MSCDCVTLNAIRAESYLAIRAELEAYRERADAVEPVVFEFRVVRNDADQPDEMAQVRALLMAEPPMNPSWRFRQALQGTE